MSQLVEVHERGMVQMIEHTKRANNCAQEAQKSSQEMSTNNQAR